LIGQRQARPRVAACAQASRRLAGLPIPMKPPRHSDLMAPRIPT